MYNVGMFTLLPEQKLKLEAMLKKIREASERTRLCVILGFHDGLSVDELAKALRISLATVYNYLNDFASGQKIHAVGLIPN